MCALQSKCKGPILILFGHYIYLWITIDLCIIWLTIFNFFINSKFRIAAIKKNTKKLRFLKTWFIITFWLTSTELKVLFTIRFGLKNRWVKKFVHCLFQGNIHTIILTFWNSANKNSSNGKKKKRKSLARNWV